MQKILRLLTPLTHDSLQEIADSGDQHSPASSVATGITAKDFIAQKSPKNDIEQIVCLADYLTQNKKVPQFKTIDLTQLNMEAACRKLSNPSATARNATVKNFLALAGGGKKQITRMGEALVKALPDRGAVKRVLETHSIRRKRKKNSLKKKKS